MIPTSRRSRAPTTCKHLERNLRLFKADRAKIGTRNEEHFRLFDRRGRRGVLPPSNTG